MKATNRQMLNKKNLREGVAADIAAPAKAIFAVLDKMKGQLPEIPYDDFIASMEDSDDGVDVSEKDLDPKTGFQKSSGAEAVEEAVSKVRDALREAVNQTVVDFLNSNPQSQTYGAYMKFCNENGVAPLSSQAYGKARGKYNEGGASDADYAGKKDPQTAELKKPVEVSEGLKKLMDACKSAEGYVETAADTVAAKYKMIGMKLKRVILGKSLKNYYLLMGDAGIGKSYIVKDCLKKCGLDPKSVPLFKGDIGASRSDVAKFFWKFKDTDLVILDDCDTILQSKNPAVQNMLKGAMDPDGHTVTISPTILKELTKSLEQEAVQKKHPNDKLFEARDLDDEDNEWDDEDGEAGDGGEGLLDTDVPTDQWEFNARVIFVSNLDESQVVKAILSRVDSYCLHLTQEEYLIRLGMIIKDMDVNSPNSGWTDEEVNDAKAEAVAMMANAIEAANKHVELCGKKVRLTHALEFRIVRDLVEGWLMLEDDYMEEHPGTGRDEAGDAIIPEFVRTILLPKL